MNDIKLNDDKLLEKFDKKFLEFYERKLIVIKYYYSVSSEECIIFDVEHKGILINTAISDIEELNCIMEIGKKLNILKEEE